MRIEDYGLIGDLGTAALVGRNGSIDWLCLPRFDSGACFAALLGDETHGRWLIAPAGEVTRTERRYRPGTLVLETDFETADGVVRVIDFMPRREGPPQLMRIVESLRGCVPMRMELRPRFDYGAIAPMVEPRVDGAAAYVGPDALHLSTPVELAIEDHALAAEFSVPEGARERFVMSWHESWEPAPPTDDAQAALARTEAWWREWSDRCTYDGEWREAVLTSLIVLKALTDETTGGIVAAPTTSLPEDLGGVRNWDYRFSWLRDSTLALRAMLSTGYIEEAEAFRRWTSRAAAGDPRDAQIMYGLGGERHLPEMELDWLPGYEGSKPVRMGNAAADQFQLDVYGEVIGVFYVGASVAGAVQPIVWKRAVDVMEVIDSLWREPDDGMWEVRGPRRHFTQSKVMAWLAYNVMVVLAERFELEGPLDHWKATRDEIHAEVCEKGYDADRNTFTQYYGSKELDANVLQIPLVGFLPGDDDRVTGTIDAVRDGLGRDGLPSRYSNVDTDDGLPGTEGQFLACSFWLVSALAINGRRDEAKELMDRLLALRNDLGLLAEEYDVDAKRQIGNFPQAFSHLALVTSAQILGGAGAH
ncbi:MAG TPA: glycoside hydrolase family 15 protein [Solirubrobacteraceae bacterium]|jgi:GH15 family glucan-1,4-alpha-glucosidase|nr:glycoside hydrolase family 15 protein [Solirubrobacteraceae bacterium]